MDERYRLSTEAEFEIIHHPEIDKIAGTYQGGCLIVGGGACMWEDWNVSRETMAHFDVMCVNMAGMVIPQANHLFSWHKKQISAIKSWRMAEWPDCKALVHSVEEYGMVNHIWRFDGGTSVSGLSAIDLAWLLGYRKICLCGIPQDGNGYFYKPTVNPNMDDKYRLNEVVVIKNRYGDIVRSLSGNTAKVMGKPDPQWARS